MAFIESGRAATLGGVDSAKPVKRINFATITEEEFRETLEEQGASPHMIEQEVEKLRKYQILADADRARRDRLRRKQGQVDVARDELGEYFEASERMEKRLLKNKKEQNDVT